MKIAYITLHWPRTASSSIGKKIIRQTEEWKKTGHDVRFFSHLHTIDNKKELVAGDRFYFEDEKNIIQREFSRISAAKKLLDAVEKYAPDIIYLRWGMYTIPMRQVFSIAPVVLEINTNDKKEHRHLGLVLNLYNRLTRSIFLRMAKGMIFTSQELAKDPAFKPYVEKFEVITNGIDLKSLPYYSAPDNEIPRLVFIGTPGMAWHGINELAQFTQENPDINVDIIGSERNDITEQIPSNMKLHGYLQGNDLENILSQADVAIGSISLHLNDMEEASPFKIRDCAGRGIPCILPYYDTDLSSSKLSTILQIPNIPDNLIAHKDTIHDFIFSMRGKRIKRDEIADKIDIVKKENERIDFFNQIVHQY